MVCASGNPEHGDKKATGSTSLFAMSNVIHWGEIGTKEFVGPGPCCHLGFAPGAAISIGQIPKVGVIFRDGAHDCLNSQGHAKAE